MKKLLLLCGLALCMALTCPTKAKASPNSPCTDDHIYGIWERGIDGWGDLFLKCSPYDDMIVYVDLTEWIRGDPGSEEIIYTDTN